MTEERPPEPKSLRLFIAVELPDEVLRALERASAMLRGAGADDGLRWTRPEGIHLTLKFLGATPPDRVPAIAAALREAAAGVREMDLQPEGRGAFHGGRHMPPAARGGREAYHYNLRVLWVGIAGDVDRLAELSARVEELVAPLGYPTEKRAFFPHLTLARMQDSADRPTRERIYRALEPYLSKSTRTGNLRPELVPEFPRFHVQRLSLMQSTIQRGGAVYRELESFPLAP